MDNYAIFKLEKLKSQGKHNLTDAYKHNARLYDVKNADPAKLKDNVTYIDTYGQSYEDIYEKTLTELKAQGVPNRTIRKDAVKGLEVVLTFSREKTDEIDIEKWAKENLDWLDKHFNPPNHEATFYDAETEGPKTIQIQNLKHVILHMDETKPHIHAFIVPIDEKGNLNSHYYNSGRQNFIQLQTDYAKAMAQFDLVRGEQHSIAIPEQMTRYYNHIIKAVESELPPPLPNETIEDYHARVNDVYQTALSNHRNEIVKKDQQIVHIQSKADKQVLDAKKYSSEEKRVFAELNDAIDGTKTLDIEREREIKQIVVDNQTFMKAVQNYPDEAEAKEAMRLYQQMIQWQLEKEEEEKRKKTKEER